MILCGNSNASLEGIFVMWNGLLVARIYPGLSET